MRNIDLKYSEWLKFTQKQKSYKNLSLEKLISTNGHLWKFAFRNYSWYICILTLQVRYFLIWPWDRVFTNSWNFSIETKPNSYFQMFEIFKNSWILLHIDYINIDIRIGERVGAKSKNIKKLYIRILNILEGHNNNCTIL